MKLYDTGPGIAFSDEHTPPTVSLDEVAESLQSIIELIENSEHSNAQDEARTLLTRIKERQ